MRFWIDVTAYTIALCFLLVVFILGVVDLVDIVRAVMAWARHAPEEISV